MFEPWCTCSFIRLDISRCSLHKCTHSSELIGRTEKQTEMSPIYCRQTQISGIWMFALPCTCLITLSPQNVTKKSHSLTATRVSQRRVTQHKLIPTNRLLNGWIFISMFCNPSITFALKTKRKPGKCMQSHVRVRSCHHSYGVTNKEQGLGNLQQSCTRSWCWHTLALGADIVSCAARTQHVAPVFGDWAAYTSKFERLIIQSSGKLYRNPRADYSL